MTTDQPPIYSYRGIGQPAPTTVDGVIAELKQFERLERIDQGGPAHTVATGNFGFDGAKFVRILADEVDRLRAENTAQAAQVAVARAELQRCMGRLEPYARQLKAAANTDAGVPIAVAVGVLRLAQERIDEADPAALDQDGEGQANG